MAQRTKLWVGVGACVLLGGQAGATEPADPLASAASSPIMLAAGGEYGGEGGEGHGGEAGHGGEGGEAAHGGEGGEGGEAAYGAGGEGGEGGEGGGYGPFSHFAGGGGGGEGGEGGEAALSVEDTPGAFYATLLLMDGHLTVGRELYTGGHRDLGATHLGHPGKELFEPIKGALGETGLNDFKAKLDALHRGAEQRLDWDKLGPRYADVQQALDEAIAEIDPELRQNPKFLADVLLAVAKTAAAEYDAAVEDGAFVNVPEYQDGRGFMTVGWNMLENAEPALSSASADTYRKMRRSWQDLMAAWPSAMPPQSPTMPASAVYAGTSRFEFAVNSL